MGYKTCLPGHWYTNAVRASATALFYTVLTRCAIVLTTFDLLAEWPPCTICNGSFYPTRDGAHCMNHGTRRSGWKVAGYLLAIGVLTSASSAALADIGIAAADTAAPVARMLPGTIVGVVTNAAKVPISG